MKTQTKPKTKNKSVDSRSVDERKRHARSKITNGRTLLPGVDGRSIWVRRFRDLIQLHLADYGGPDNCSEAKKALVRRASCLIVELEQLEQKFAINNGAKGYQIERYQRLTNTLRRTLECLGLERRPKDITPPLDATQVIIDGIREVVR